MPILIIWWLLILYWIFAIYSVSVYESFELTLKFVSKGLMDEPSNYFYFFRQIKSLLIWWIIALIVRKIPFEFIKKQRNKIFLAILVLQLLVVFTPLWVTLNGAKWWLYIKWLWTLQPSEFFKLAFVMFMSWWFLKKQKLLWTIKWFLWFIVVVSIFFLVFFLIPDLGTLLILGPVMLLMYWYIWGRLTYILFLVITGLFLWVTIGMQFDYVKKRFSYFMDSNVDETGRGIGWQLQQWNIAIWWWWWFGKWYGKWLQKFWYIPEAQSDFIFSAFSEEVWLIGNSVLLTLYFLLLFYFVKRLPHIKDNYRQLLWVWIMSLILIQVFVNIWWNLKLLPLTGLTLPFISYGWSSLIVNMVELILLYKLMYEEPKLATRR